MMRKIQTDNRRHRPVGQDRELFDAKIQLPTMSILIDHQLIDPPATGPDLRTDAQKLLAGLLDAGVTRDKQLEVHRYADDGPPAQTPSITHHGVALYPGWAVATPRCKSWDVHHGSDSGISLSGVMGNAVEVAAADKSNPAYASRGADEARKQRYADQLAVEVASQAVNTDLYITEREYLHTSRRRSRETTVCTVDEALAILGLYQRTLGRYRVQPQMNYNRGLFSRVGTRELVPAAWRWFGATVEHGTHTSDETLSLLAGSLLPRVEQALAARDHVHVALNLSQNNDTRDEALTALDDVTYRLMAAFDVAARVAHHVYGISGKQRDAGWQSTGWLNKVAAHDPALGDTIRSGTDNAHVLTILRSLRNTIHGQALQGIHVSRSGTADESLVALNREDEAEILEAIDALGGRDRWGVQTLLPGRVHVKPGTLVEVLFAEVLPVLNALLDATDVARLAGVAVTTASSTPPTTSPFDAEARFSIRKQYGL